MQILEKLKGIRIDKKKACLIPVLIIMLIVFVKSLGGSNAQAKSSSVNVSGGKENYECVYAVPGVSFEMNKELSDYATAIVEISKDIIYDSDSSYSYKNGSDTYMTFCMNQYVVIVHRGTEFDFNTEEIKESLGKHSLEGIWFSEYGNDAVQKQGNKTVVDVIGQVVVTNLLYNDFYGKLVTITDSGEEWSLFVGVTDTTNEAMNEFVNYVAGTFVRDAQNVGEDLTIYEVSIDETPELKAVPVIEKESEPSTDSEILVAALVTGPEETQESYVGPEEIEDELIEVEETHIETFEETEDINESIEESESAEEIIVVEIEQERELEEENLSLEMSEPEVIVARQVNTQSNQQSIKYDEDKAYTSNIYSMLKISQIGYMNIINQNTVSFDEAFVSIRKINDEEETKKLISEYIKSGNAPYSSITSPVGCHFESAEYEVKYPDPEGLYYTDIQFLGLDGEQLKYKGVAYDKRTFDILNKTREESGWTKGLIVFYAVPNGCKEYVLACGDRAGEGYQAYYQIRR